MPSGALLDVGVHWLAPLHEIGGGEPQAVAASVSLLALCDRLREAAEAATG